MINTHTKHVILLNKVEPLLSLIFYLKYHTERLLDVVYPLSLYNRLLTLYSLRTQIQKRKTEIENRDTHEFS